MRDVALLRLVLALAVAQHLQVFIYLSILNPVGEQARLGS
jgi:hypothetical protein